MKKRTGKTLAAFLAVIMLFGTLPVGAFAAADETGNTGTNFKDSAYYNVSWAPVTLPVDETVTDYGSAVLDKWDGVQTASEIIERDEDDFSDLVSDFSIPSEALYWHGWVGEDR